ncbi:MAG: serine protease [Thermoguttaceae bacterium]
MRTVYCLLSIAWGLLATPAGAQCPGGSCPVAAVPPAAIVRVANAAGSARWYGSGTLVYRDQQRGVVLTCAHLFREKTGDVSVVFPDGARFQAEVLAIDETWDLAALGIAPPAVAPVTVASESPRPGDVLRSCGYGPDGRYRCNQGEALGYTRPAVNATYETLELRGAAREGDSGGPVFNSRGELAAVLWGTDGRTVGSTYCGRVRKFLAAIFARFRAPSKPTEPENHTPAAPLLPWRSPIIGDHADQLRQRLEGLGGELQSTRQRLDDQGRSLGERLEKITGLITGLKDRLEKAESVVGEGNLRAIVREVAGSALAEHGPGLLETALPALLTALGWTGPPSLAAVLALRLAAGFLRRRVKKRKQTSAGQGRTQRSLNDDYARQLAEVYALSGHSSTADATLGREYDEALLEAAQSSDGTLSRWAKQLRERVAQRFYRIHGDSPSPAEPIS